MYADLHKDAPYHNGTFGSWVKERSASHPYHFSDGVTFGVAGEDLAPHDKFTTDEYASPVARRAADEPHDEHDHADHG